MMKKQGSMEKYRAVFLLPDVAEIRFFIADVFPVMEIPGIFNADWIQVAAQPFTVGKKHGKLFLKHFQTVASAASDVQDAAPG